MVFDVATFSGQTSQSGAPGSYVADELVSEWYVVSLVEGWSFPAGSPSGGTIYLWQHKGVSGNSDGDGPNLDVCVGSITLPTTVGQSASVQIAGNSGNLAATIVLTGGSSPTFTGQVIADGNMTDSFPGL